MNTSFKLLALSLTLSALASGCSKPPDAAAAAPPPNISVGTEIDDSVVTTRVKTALLADPEVKSLDVKIETRKGEVMLSGFVDSMVQIERVTSVTKAVEGVHTIDNKLSLKGADTTVGAKVDDSIVTAKVKAALLADANVKSADIAVVTRNGEVQLSGFVNNKDQIERAVMVARGIEGTKSVTNEMALKK